MVKIFLSIILFVNIVFADIYQTNCSSCHQKIDVTLEKLFFRYLLKYSSEKNVKKSLIEYLQNPTVDTTVMPEAFIKRYGIKKKTTLKDEELRKAIDIYWEKYKVFGKLK
ncbi:MAG: hypothetical protein K8R39_05430 [Arcobacteraceae bacterium]|nr:hypothetical protein [Arcobacteraceae bacterium]